MTTEFGPLLERFTQLIHARLAGLSPHDVNLAPVDRVLPVATGLLNARLAADRDDRDAAWSEAADAGVHLALLAGRTDPPEVRLLDFERRQHRRFTFGAEVLPAWTEKPWSHHFGRALTHGVRLAYLVDPATRQTSTRSLADEAADTANYVLFFLLLRVGRPAAAARL